MRVRVVACSALVLLACGGESDRSAEVPPTTSLVTTDPATTLPPDEDDEEGESSSGSADESSEDGGSSGGAEEGYPHIARVQVPAEWLREDGLWDPPFEGTSPIHPIGRAFYADHPDAWDYLVVYTEGELVGGNAFADTVAYDIAGIGLPVDDWVRPSDAGSAGRLQQINVMNTPQYYAWQPDVPEIVVHELAHRWSAFIELPGTPGEGWLLDESFAHWNVHVSTGGPSATGYGELVDMGGGVFRFTAVRPLQLSSLELYLAGLMPPEEVGPLFWVADPYGHEPAVSPLTGQPFSQKSYGEDVTFSGTRVDFTIDDVIAANGPRVPAFGDAQTHFRFAFVMVCHDPAACPEDDLAIVEAQRVALPDLLAGSTGGRASADVSLTP